MILLVIINLGMSVVSLIDVVIGFMSCVTSVSIIDLTIITSGFSLHGINISGRESVLCVCEIQRFCNGIIPGC